MSSREAAGLLDVGKTTAYLAFVELQELGFIRIAQRGAFTIKNRRASTWILTEFDYNGCAATKDFMKPHLASNSNNGSTHGTNSTRGGTVGVYDRAESPLTVPLAEPKPP